MNFYYGKLAPVRLLLQTISYYNTTLYYRLHPPLNSCYDFYKNSFTVNPLDRTAHQVMCVWCVSNINTYPGTCSISKICLERCDTIWFVLFLCMLVTSALISWCAWRRAASYAWVSSSNSQLVTTRSASSLTEPSETSPVCTRCEYNRSETEPALCASHHTTHTLNIQAWISGHQPCFWTSVFLFWASNLDQLRSVRIKGWNSVVELELPGMGMGFKMHILCIHFYII